MRVPKVSVIVPIYNVEKYINRCIDSILNQTYKNIEVILVDDGSPDRCGEIIDKYAEKDKRIKTIHKKNGGLSDARNHGMREITGDLTLFVDSDDWLKLDMLEIMVNEIVTSNADVVQAAFYYAYDGYLLYDDRYYTENMDSIVLNNYELMKELVINERVKNFAWGKLYKTNLIKNIYFKEGVLFEDVFWAHRVMKNVNKYVILHKPLCYYLQRNDSIVANYSVRNLDILEGLKERQKFIEKNYKNLVNESNKILVKTSIFHYNLLTINSKKDKNKVYRNKIKSYIYNNYDNFIKAFEDEKSFKNQLLLFKIWPPLNMLIILKDKILKILRIKKRDTGLKKIIIEN